MPEIGTYRSSRRAVVHVLRRSMDGHALARQNLHPRPSAQLSRHAGADAIRAIRAVWCAAVRCVLNFGAIYWVPAV